MDHGGQGARTPQATPSVRRRWAHSTVLGAWSASLWGLVPGAAPGGDRCPFPGKWKGLLESPIRPCGRIRPSPPPGPLRGAGGGGGEWPLECQAQVGSLTQSKKLGPGLAGT